MKEAIDDLWYLREDEKADNVPEDNKFKVNLKSVVSLKNKKLWFVPISLLSLLVHIEDMPLYFFKKNIPGISNYHTGCKYMRIQMQVGYYYIGRQICWMKGVKKRQISFMKAKFNDKKRWKG